MTRRWAGRRRAAGPRATLSLTISHLLTRFSNTFCANACALPRTAACSAFYAFMKRGRLLRRSWADATRFCRLQHCTLANARDLHLSGSASVAFLASLPVSPGGRRSASDQSIPHGAVANLRLRTASIDGTSSTLRMAEEPGPGAWRRTSASLRHGANLAALAYLSRRY